MLECVAIIFASVFGSLMALGAFAFLRAMSAKAAKFMMQHSSCSGPYWCWTQERLTFHILSAGVGIVALALVALLFYLLQPNDSLASAPIFVWLVLASVLAWIIGSLGAVFKIYRFE